MFEFPSLANHSWLNGYINDFVEAQQLHELKTRFQPTLDQIKRKKRYRHNCDCSHFRKLFPLKRTHLIGSLHITRDVNNLYDFSLFYDFSFYYKIHQKECERLFGIYKTKGVFQSFDSDDEIDTNTSEEYFYSSED
jgi:hypothetical protein